MRNSFRISFSLKNTYRVNSILYAVKQIPILKKLLPDSLYRMRGFKIAGWILSVMWEVLSAVMGKVIYFLFLAGCTLGLKSIGELSDKASIYMNLFLFLSLIGAVTNLYMFDTHKSKYYAIMLMNMNAKKYNIVNYIYSLLKLLVCYIVALPIIGMIFNIPVWLCIISAFGVVGMKSAVVGFMLNRFDTHTKDVTSNNPFGKLTFPFVILSALLAAGLPVLNINIPYAVMGILMVMFIMLGVWGFVKISKFDSYRQLTFEVMNNADKIKYNKQQVAKENAFKSISNEGNFESKKSGFEYLNELFIKRHSKILWKPVKIISAVCFAFFALAFMAVLRFPQANEDINSLLMTMLPYFMFIMYAINRGTGFTQAVFINCDHSLLTYSVYKKPANILKLFRIRLREVIKMNLLPGLIIGCGLAGLLYLTGGTDNPVNYCVLLVSTPAMSIFFSTHNLVIYYLLQPYNANTEIKSGMYQVVMGVTYMICWLFMQVELPTLIFGLSIIIFCLLYFAVACLLVYKLAPKTFKIRV